MSAWRSVASQSAQRLGFDGLLAEHRRAWASRWEDADVIIEGDPELQLAVRFAIFHLLASAPDDGEAAVGARGLTGSAYRGHVFWDTDVYVLPMLAATHPHAARAMLEYRVRRLPAASEPRKRHRRDGARFPWESARSGGDVTPEHARDRNGELVPILTGRLEEHIVADVAWAAACYIDWTDDQTFAAGPGRELIVQTARVVGVADRAGRRRKRPHPRRDRPRRVPRECRRQRLHQRDGPLEPQARRGRRRGRRRRA